MHAVKNVWVLAEKLEVFAELCAGARQLGETISALLIGTKSEAGLLAGGIADRVYWLEKTSSDGMLEDYVPALSELLAGQRPEVLLVGAGKRGRLMAGRLAARLGTAVLSDVTEFVIVQGRLQCKRLVYGGTAVRTEKAASGTVIAIAGSGAFNTAPAVAAPPGTIASVAAGAPGTGIRCLEKRPKGGVKVNLAAAKRVLAVGRGIAAPQDLNMITEFAGLIGAELGCTRPLAEGVNWLPRERYLGVSGVMCKPEVYIGAGISGQVQHMVGCDQAGTIFAINKDKTSPIFSQADYGVVGDLYTIIPALIEKLKGKQAAP
ncbi:electron transfer flavoprotein subunit alpha/FixB family protein [Sporomusa aerivorans]|uniref:electron transfer flavoprotein subunit alpha/FixB family protein n=1 Tax=Sporomusa aerivorans TaxID=204936 RepID=UPI00352BCCD2